MKRHCDKCKYSYKEMEHGILTQFCNNSDYNSCDYTHEMLMEDWGKGHCRFWEAKEEEEQNAHSQNMG